MVDRSTHADRPYGGIYVKDNAGATTLTASGVHVQVEVFSVNGESDGMTPDHTQNHITILRTGRYLVIVSAAIQNTAGVAHEVHFDVAINNRNATFDSLHSDRTLGAGTDKGSFSMNGIVVLTAGDTVELWAATERALASTVVFEDISLNIYWAGN